MMGRVNSAVSPYADVATSAAPRRLNYRATQSQRLAWTEVPAALIAAVEHQLGATIRHAGAPSTMGFTASYAGTVQLSDGRTVFAKAALASQPIPYEGIQREAEVLAGLPLGFPACQVLAAASDDTAATLVLANVVGHNPGLPWTSLDAALVLRALEDMQRRAQEIDPHVIRSETIEKYAEHPVYQAGISALLGPRAALPPWLPHLAYARAMGELARDANLGPSDGVCHHDVRPDNLLIDDVSQRAVLLDWNWAMRGPRWIDAAGLLPTLHADGFPTQQWMTSPLFAGVKPDAIDGFFALLIAYFIDAMRQPIWPGCDDTVRHHQAWYAHMFATYLGHRRGW